MTIAHLGSHFFPFFPLSIFKSSSSEKTFCLRGPHAGMQSLPKRKENHKELFVTQLCPARQISHRISAKFSQVLNAIFNFKRHKQQINLLHAGSLVGYGKHFLTSEQIFNPLSCLICSEISVLKSRWYFAKSLWYPEYKYACPDKYLTFFPRTVVQDRQSNRECISTVYFKKWRR